VIGMRRLRKKYKSPRSPWDKMQIAEEKKLLKEYGLKNKKELLRAMEILRNFRRRARELEAEKNPIERKRLLDKLVKMGIMETGKELDDVLALTVRDILNRRLQTVVFKKGLCKTIKHARQLIVHGKIEVNGRRVDTPSYIVALEEENKIKVKEGVK